MITVKKGDVCRLRDGRVVFVTDASDTSPDAYRVYNFRVGRNATGQAWAEEYVISEMPAETILVGNPVSAGMVVDENVSIITDWSEVVEVIRDQRVRYDN